MGLRPAPFGEPARSIREVVAAEGSEGRRASSLLGPIVHSGPEVLGLRGWSDLCYRLVD